MKKVGIQYWLPVFVLQLALMVGGAVFLASQGHWAAAGIAALVAVVVSTALIVGYRIERRR